MLGANKSRGYYLMICADFLAGANLENGNTELLLQSVMRYLKFLPSQRNRPSWNTRLRKRREDVAKAS